MLENPKDMFDKKKRQLYLMKRVSKTGLDVFCDFTYTVNSKKGSPFLPYSGAFTRKMYRV